jgi:2,5-dihydroxypyridine 5,6-dioxygenase
VPYNQDLELAVTAYKTVRDLCAIRQGESLLITIDSEGHWPLAEETAKAAQALRAKVMVAWHTTPKGYGRAADLYLPDCIHQAILNTDVWIEYNYQWLLYGSAWEQAVKAGRVRYLFLGGLSIDQIIRNIGKVDLALQKEFQELVADVTARARRMRITTPAGTDVTFENVPGRPVNSEGWATKPGVTTFLLGQIGWAPDEDSINGTIVFDGAFSGGGEAELGRLKEPIFLKVSRGRIEDISGGAEAAFVASWIFFVICVIATGIAVKSFGGWSAALSIEKTGMSFSEAVFLNAGAWGGFVMLMPDITRFLKSRREVYTIVPVAFILGSIPPMCGVLLGATVGVPLERLFVELGIGFLGLLSIIGIGWTTNDSNAYTAGLALSTAMYPWKRLLRSKATTIVAVLGVIGAMTGIGQLGFFQWIAGFHGSYNMSFVGVMLAHYAIIERDKVVQTNGLSGLISWLTTGTLSHFRLLPVPVITGIILAFVMYLVLYRYVEKPLFGEKIVDRLTPHRFT